MDKIQKKFLLTMCELWDGRSSVSLSSIRKRWRECPDHDLVVNLGLGEYFFCDLSKLEPSYLPTDKALQIVREIRRDRLAIATLFVAVLTLGLTICQFLFQ